MELLSAPPLIARTEQDFLPLSGTDYIEFYVGNAKQAAHYYMSAYGFRAFAYAGPETGLKDRVSYVVRQNRLTFMFTTALRMSDPIAEHVFVHGDSVKVIALRVKDSADAFKQTKNRGAKVFLNPKTIEDEYGKVVMSGIHTYGETVHLFIERKNYRGIFMPGFVAWQNPHFQTESTGLLYVDHCVGNVGWNRIGEFVSFYENIMGFRNTPIMSRKDIVPESSVLMSKGTVNGSGIIKFPINEPSQVQKRSEVEDYLEYNNGEGVQHIALATDDIIATVSALRSRGVEFLHIPCTYYDELPKRVGMIDEDLSPLKELGILVDRDHEGYLLHLFTRPIVDRPTLFFEIIQRKGAQGFGRGNSRALSDAFGRAQSSRINL